MKQIFLLVFLVSSYNITCLAQQTPVIYLSTNQFIQGNANKKDTIKISFDNDFKPDTTYLIKEKNGDFTVRYKNELSAGQTTIIVWKTDDEGNNSEYLAVPVKSAISALADVAGDKLNVYLKSRAIPGLTSYKARIINTNFTIPMARFNFSGGDDSKIGNILLFNSVGAGVGFSGGQLNEIADENGEVLSQTFQNTIGFYIGFLFSAGTGDDAKNVFAPTVNLTLLDFQLGLGYELGTITENQRRPFLTLSYSVPLYKLSSTGFWIFSKSPPLSQQDIRVSKGI